MKDLDLGHSYELYDELHNAEKFITQYGLQSVEQIKMLGRAEVWLCYYIEAAEVIFTDGDDHSIHFRKLRNKTMIYSLDLNYYTEEYKVFNILDHFEGYIAASIQEFEAMSYRN